MSRYDAVLLDAFGTLIDIDEPYGRLRGSLRRHLGVEVSAADAERAFLAEMDYYADHCHEGSDEAALAGLRARCAAIVLRELGIDADPALAAVLLRDSIAFRAFDDAAPLLAGLDRAGVAVAVVSNWDCSLREALAGVGIEIELVVDSASAGSSKPDPGIFRRAVERPSASSPGGRCTSATPRRPTAPAPGPRASTCASSIVARSRRPRVPSPR